MRTSHEKQTGDRRGFIASAAALPLVALTSRLHGAATRPNLDGYGALEPAIDETTQLPLIYLPKGFRYLSFGWTGDRMTDGSRTPHNHDGMGIVSAVGDVVTLVRNHEISGRGKPFGGLAGFDAGAPGGCTTLVFDSRQEKLVSAVPSISGTVQNCAGGVTPWGTWLTCEENLAGVDTKDRDGRSLQHREEHGWVFEVKPDSIDDKPVPLTGLGRFVHEAVCVDPKSGIVYLTEDSNPAGLYRFVPTVRGDLAKGGVLEMLAANTRPDLRTGLKKDAEFPVRWVPIEDPSRPHSPGTTDGEGVYSQGSAQGGSSFARLEGILCAAGRIYINATTGGNAKQGQVWEYTPGAEKLRLVFESPSAEILNMPDNMCMSPQGCLVICEDGGRVGQRLQGVTQDGRIFPFAVNATSLRGQKNGFQGDFAETEWAGVCFSPDGKWLFANLQTPGFTVAITGPWEKGPF